MADNHETEFGQRVAQLEERMERLYAILPMQDDWPEGALTERAKIARWLEVAKGEASLADSVRRGEHGDWNETQGGTQKSI